MSCPGHASPLREHILCLVTVAVWNLCRPVILQTGNVFNSDIHRQSQHFPDYVIPRIVFTRNLSYAV